MSPTLLSWNVAGRVRRQPEQTELIAQLAPDLVCLQEVRPTTARAWTDALQSAGWPHVAIARSNAPAGDTDRRLSVLTAAKRPLTEIEIDHDIPWPERVLATGTDGLHLVNLHSPISPKPNLVKVRTHEAIHATWPGRRTARRRCAAISIRPAANTRTAASGRSLARTAVTSGPSAESAGTRPSWP